MIAPSEEHDSTARALATLKTAGLEHDIVKTITLDQVFPQLTTKFLVGSHILDLKVKAFLAAAGTDVQSY